MSNKKESLVSIILPVFNRAYCIAESIKSVLQQTYKNFELIIVDDGSTDNVDKVIDRFNDNRIKYIRNEDNMGVSIARNIGIQNAQGDFIAFQDSDDIWMPTKLQKQIFAMHNAPEAVGVVYVGMELHEDSKVWNPLSQYRLETLSGNIFDKLLTEPLTSTQTLLIRKEVFDDIGLFRPDFFVDVDIEICLRIAKKYEFVYLPEQLVRVVIGKDSITRKYKNYLMARITLFQMYCDDYKRIGKERECYFFWLNICDSFLNGEEQKESYEMVCKCINESMSGEESNLFLREFFLSKIEEQKKQIRRLEILNAWYKKKEAGFSIYNWLKGNGFKKVAIYGWGDMGKAIAKSIREEGEMLSYVVDQRADEIKECHVKILSPGNSNLKFVDALIVSTVNSYAEVICEYKDKHKLLFIEDIINTEN